jgi:hypothetical protein
MKTNIKYKKYIKIIGTVFLFIVVPGSSILIPLILIKRLKKKNK